MAKDNYTELGNRIEELLKHLRGAGVEINNGILAEALDMDASQLSGVKTGKYSFTYMQIMKLNSIYGVRSSWLLEGELPVFKQESGDQQPPDSHLLTQIEDYAQGILSSLREIKQAPRRAWESGTKVVPQAVQTAKASGKTKTSKKQEGNDL